MGIRRLVSLIAMTALAVSGCVSASNSGSSAAQPAGQVPAKVEPAAKIQFWHAMSGVNGDAVNKMVDGFNKSQSKIQVEPIFQGTYDDALAKLKTALPSGGAPALMQVYDIGQRFMIDSGEIVAVQDYIDRDKYDVSDLEPAVLNYYKVQDKLYSMPFNASSAILYYNKDAFKEVGLDPNKPPKTFDEVTDAAKKLTKGTGNDKRYGFGPSIYGWLFEQWIAVSGGLFADNGNGRDARATKVVFDDARGKAILDFWKAGVDGGYFFNPGIDNDGAANAFNAGKTAMYVESTARLRGHINAAKFEVGTGLYPRPNNAPADGGNIIGGASLYMLKSRPQAEQEAAWEFIKYVASAPVQAQWQVDTGYYSIRKSAENEPVAKEWVAKYPQFKTAVDQIRQAPQNRMTNGAVIGVFPQARARVQKAIESTLLGQEDSAKALSSAAEELTKAIDGYNKSTGK
ncbi:MAG: ABC transporter substrate-binding protein [Chloroflexi bacterium]|nr:ABC transporter substrate-binding protein [Chloroflexota bacterium]